MNCLSMFDHFAGLALKGLSMYDLLGEKPDEKRLIKNGSVSLAKKNQILPFFQSSIASKITECLLEST